MQVNCTLIMTAEGLINHMHAALNIIMIRYQFFHNSHRIHYFFRLKLCYKRSPPQHAKISLSDSDIFQLHSPDPSLNSLDETIPPLPPPLPPLKDLKIVKSHIKITRRLRIADFVLHRPSCPGAVSPDRSFKESSAFPSLSSSPLTTCIFASSTPLHKGGSPSFFPPDKVAPSPISAPPTGGIEPGPANSKSAKRLKLSLPHPSQEKKLPGPPKPDQMHKQPAAPPKGSLKLNDEDRATLLSGNWLTDKHISVANKLMAQKFPSQHGLQNTLVLDKYDRYQSSNEDFVQLVNVAGKHWVCTSNRLSPPGMVYVYDSLPSCSVNSSSLHRQIAAIMKTEDAAFVVKHVDVQRQVGSSDCRLMAIAFAVSLCSGLDPHTLKYDQSKLRSDFLSCVETREWLPLAFPHTWSNTTCGKSILCTRKGGSRFLYLPPALEQS